MNSSSTDSQYLLPGINPDNTLGAAFIGYSFACAVFGVLTAQVTNYYQTFVADPKQLRILVGIVWYLSLELIHVILISHALYHYTITLFGSMLEMITGHVVWSLVTQVLVAGISGSIVKLCFVLRVWRFSRRNVFITGLIFIVVLVQFGFIIGSCKSNHAASSPSNLFGIVKIIAYTIAAYQIQSFLDLPKLQVLGSIALATGALGDVLTAVALIFYLRKLRTGYTEPDSLVNNLTGYAIHTGAFTSAMTLLTLIFYDAYPNTFQYMAVYFVVSKTFAVSLMCTLNTRKQVAGRALEEDEDIQSSDSSLIIPQTSPPFNMKSSLQKPGPNHIQPYLLKECTLSPSRMDTKLPFSARNRRTSVASLTHQKQDSEPQTTRVGVVLDSMSMSKKA
ncbi:hypothetical protein LENED_004367 [Lentinula edodes]|uniref:DUF6534 domain-containing protein n=1 Tax=Lentinula edodes TaxID=5353 RepID=A0A1Q3E6N9_LENED|nr:hypothetical protein LENED_004367 [Lentinula edodes]